jgi:hypothetical protein
MNKILEILGLLPKAVQVAIAGMLFGGIAFAAHEQRYMTVGQYTKSYVLDLKREIRNIEKDLADSDLPARVRDVLKEQLDQMIDELCYEIPDDPYCRARDREPD